MIRRKMSSLSDSVLSSVNWWLGWIAIVGTSLGLLSAIGTHLARREIGHRQSQREAEKEKRLADAEARVVQQTEKLAGAAKQLEAAHAEAATARELAERLREKSQPRQLTGPQISAIKSLGGEFPKGTRVDLGFRSDDPEAFDFAMQFVNALSAEGFDVHWNSMMLVKIPNGVHVNTGYTNQKLVRSMISAFDRSEFRYNYGTVSGKVGEPPDSSLLMLIGSKP